MNLLKPLISQIELSQSLIELELKRISDVRKLLAKTIEDKYPLESLVGQPMVYHKTQWGDIESDQLSTLGVHKLHAYSYLVPGTCRTGKELNAGHNCRFFNENALYVLYVAYEWDSGEAPDPESALIHEFLAIEMKNE